MWLDIKLFYRLCAELFSPLQAVRSAAERAGQQLGVQVQLVRKRQGTRQALWQAVIAGPDADEQTFAEAWRSAITPRLLRHAGLQVIVSEHRSPAPPQRREPKQPHEEQEPTVRPAGLIIAVASGKGGVGKSTVCVGLALALRRRGLNVGILDADVYGPSIPHLLALNTPPKVVNGRLQADRSAEGVAVLSLGNAVSDALIWRGPMASGAVQKLFAADWGPLDVLLIDLPPGTGDIPLTVARKIAPDGVVIVTTPSPVALQAVQRGLGLWAKLQIPIKAAVCTFAPYSCICGALHAPLGAYDDSLVPELPQPLFIEGGGGDRSKAYDALAGMLMQG